MATYPKSSGFEDGLEVRALDWLSESLGSVPSSVTGLLAESPRLFVPLFAHLYSGDNTVWASGSIHSACEGL